MLLAEPADTLRVRKMDEVVVASTPKEHTSLRQQSLSSSSFGIMQLQEEGINDIKDLTAHVPGLFIPNYGSRLTSSVYLRGVGSRIGTPTIGMYVDNVPLAGMSSMDQDMSDAERIDVLRGPQGTLYGRNAIGGIIRVYTKNPMNYQGTDIMLGGATYNNYRTRVTHYHRPLDNLAFSAGISYEHLGGFHRNVCNGQRADRSNDIAARWRGIYIPSDKVRLDLSARYQWTRQGGYPYAAKQGDDAGSVAYNRASSYLRHLLSVGLNAEHDLGGIMMTSTTGFQYLKDDMFMDQDFSRQDIYSLRQKQLGKVLSEEIALKSKGAGRWQWTSGANVQYRWLRTEAPVTFYPEGVDWLSQLINRSLPDLTAYGMGPMTVTLKDNIRPMGGTFQTPTLNTGLFHQSTIAVAGGLSLTVGVRLDYERYEMTHNAPGSVYFDFDIDGSTPRNSIHLTNLNVEPTFLGTTGTSHLHCLPKASLKYDLGRTGNVYASVSRGYRSGGYNVQMISELMQAEMRRLMMESIRPDMPSTAQPDVSQATEYKPETAWNYEAGCHLDCLGGRIAADIAAFWIETRDLQLSQMAESGMGRVTVNASRSRSIGMEASLQASLTHALSLNAGYGYTHATLRHSGDDDHSDDYLVPFAPQHTLSLGARYAWQTRGWLQHICLYAGGRANGRIYWTRENDLSQPFYALLDARLSVTHNDLEVSLWGRNLTQTHYDAFCFVTRGQVFSQRGTPLQIGLDLRLRL